MFIPVVKYGYPLIEKYIAYLLIATVFLMILRDNKKIWAFLIFLISGCLGIVVLNIPNLSNPLFPLLSGLFGVATLAVSIYDKQNIPPQKDDSEITIKKSIVAKALISGQFSGFVTATLPGLSAGIAAVMSMQITKKLGDQGFMILVGSIGTVSFILSITTMFVINKARNGSIIAVQQLMGVVDGNIILVFLCATLIAGGAGVLLCLIIGKAFAAFITKVNYTKLVSGVIIFVIFMILLLTGWIGILVLFVSTAVGILPARVKVTRTHTMACLLLPVILYFLL